MNRDCELAWGIARDVFEAGGRVYFVGGVVRDRLAAIWQQMRENGFSGENVGRLLDGYNAALNESGAFYRDAVRWNRPNSYSENYNIFSYASARFEMMDRRIEEMTSEALRGHRLRIQGYTTFDEGPLSYE